MKDQRIKCIVSGLVQGVFFRDFTNQNAHALGLTGTVRNKHDGSVEVIAEGGKEDLEKLIELLRKGPPHARIENVNVEWSDARGDFMSFAVTF